MPQRTGIFLQADWRHLLMLNYAVDPVVLKRRAPSATEIDLFDGQAFVSVVGFRFLNTRICGVPVPFHINFEEYAVLRPAQSGGRVASRGCVCA